MLRLTCVHCLTKSGSHGAVPQAPNGPIGAINLLWTVQPNLTLGVEYGYGERENKDNSTLDSHRVMFGVQIY